jgi:phosphatidylglycerophosphate synthase
MRKTGERNTETLSAAGGRSHLTARLRKLGQVVGDATGVNLLIKTAKTLPDELSEKTTVGRAAFTVANTLSLARLAYNGKQLAKNWSDPMAADTERSWSETTTDGVVGFLDVYDGLVAKKLGGQTKFGGVIDQLVGDKAARVVKEVDMARRGRIHPAHIAVRGLRDLCVTYQRAAVLRKSDGAVSVDAIHADESGWRKVLTGPASTVHYMVSNSVLDSPVGAKMSRPTREVLATAVDAHMIATGLWEVSQYRKELQKYQRDPMTYGQAETETDTEISTPPDCYENAARRAGLIE